MTRRMMILLSVLTVLSLILVACAPAAPQAAAEATQVPAEAEVPLEVVTFMTWPGDKFGFEEAKLQELVDQFQADNPTIEVDLALVPRTD